MKMPRPTSEFPDGIKPRGTLIDHRQAALLVRMGVAEAVDDECKKAANMTPEKTAAAVKAYNRLEKGIATEDFKAFDEGVMCGYNPDGSWIPGPHYEEAAWKNARQTAL